MSHYPDCDPIKMFCDSGQTRSKHLSGTGPKMCGFGNARFSYPQESGLIGSK